MMYIASVDSSLDEDELILEITDGVLTCRAFCHPCSSSVGEIIEDPLRSLDTVGVRHACEPGSIVEQSAQYGLWIRGQIFERQRSRKLPSDIQPVALRKLRMLNRAESLQDLRVPPANQLERLVGDRPGQYSIRVNDQWRTMADLLRMARRRSLRRRDR